MTMKHIAVISMLVFLAIIQSVGGFNLEPSLPGWKCKCLKQTMKFVHPSSYKQVEIFPPRPSCPLTEILITLKNTDVVCVDPSAKWVKKLMDFLKQSRRTNRSRSTK